MRTYLAAFALSALVSGIFTPLVRLLAFRIGAVSRPGGRHVHGRETPRLGGLAIFAGFFAPLMGLFFVQSVVAQAFTQDVRKVIGLFAGGALLCGVGAIDDTRGLRALHKLYAQVAVAVLAFACGFRIDAISLPFVGELSMGIFALPVTVLWIVGIVNAVNLIDGLDGLAAGVVFFAGLTNFVVAYLSFGTLPALFMATMMGTIIGFLFYNFNPARIFMGDSGSYFLGYVIASTSLIGATQKASTAVSLLVPVVALGVPIFDTLFAMVRRWLERRPLFSPDRGHIHHRLLDMGITHRRAVLIIYGVSVLLTVAAIGISLGRSWQVGLALVASSVVFMGLVRAVGYFEEVHGRRRQKERLRSRDSEILRRLLPRLPARFEAARSEADVLSALGLFALEGQLSFVEILPVTGGEPTAFRWTNPKDDDPFGRDVVSARYPIGRDDAARAELKFGFRSDFGDVSPQTEVLLQVVTDMVEASLSRVGSLLAPRVLADAEAPEAAALAAASEIGR
ncbi:glycosyltransferase family 4 protein [Polyangium spumosum]|uniref:Undecaprenyl/decaprenyl-phosphate alpha-N-acetylglucosaminyl 1-phosphate transferase n=1 Tax=Polyangium spumosum TaxID=889282 RepID=A0A6N7PKL6_9BACT|nr:MraY family glycosyltransferase [Polyangium spumosum]MRG92603.1 undecaprenyl/decaprenyl-phosphate alpha-N-acetylglucosaminyl 1-phosphate transferase [Polyangium spumosum]